MNFVLDRKVGKEPFVDSHANSWLHWKLDIIGPVDEILVHPFVLKWRKAFQHEKISQVGAQLYDGGGGDGSDWIVRRYSYTVIVCHCGDLSSFGDAAYTADINLRDANRLRFEELAEVVAT